MGILDTLANAGITSALFGGSFGNRLGQQAAVDVGSNLVSGLIGFGGNQGGLLQDTAIKAGIASVAFGGSFLDRAKEQGVASLISGAFGLGGRQQQHGFGGQNGFDQNPFDGFGNQPFQPTWQRGGFVPLGMQGFGFGGGQNNGFGFNQNVFPDIRSQGGMLHNAGINGDFQGGQPRNYNQNDVGAALNVIMQALNGGPGGGRGGF